MTQMVPLIKSEKVFYDRNLTNHKINPPKSEISKDVSFLSCCVTLCDQARGVSEYTCDGIAQSGAFHWPQLHISLIKKNVCGS